MNKALLCEPLGGKADYNMNYVRATPDSLFGDVPDLDSGKAAEIVKDGEKWKSLRPSKRC